MNVMLLPRVRTVVAILSATALLVAGTPIARAQSPEPSPDVPAGGVVTSIGGLAYGGTLGAAEGRDPNGEPALRLGSTIDGLQLIGQRDAFAPGESISFRLEFPGAVESTTLRAHVTAAGETVESIVGSGDWITNPSWDTMTGVLPAPPVGNYELRVFRGAEPVASAPLAVIDVPRLDPPLTDRTGLLVDSIDLVDAAALRFEQATGGWLWYVYVDNTGGRLIDDYAADVWRVNDDQLLDMDAVAVVATTDRNAAIQVGPDLGWTATAEEVAAHEEAIRAVLDDDRLLDTIDLIADGLIVAHQTPPPEPGSTPPPGPTPTPRSTPEPTPTPEPTSVPVPNVVGLTREDAQTVIARVGLNPRITFRQTGDAPEGTVLSQAPEPGREVEPGTTVTIEVATAPTTVAVPNVTGDTESDAFGALLDAGLEPGQRSGAFSDRFPAGIVLRTNPRAGTVVQRGTTVDYVVSRGPQPTPSPVPTPTPTPGDVIVPNLRGQPENDAVNALFDAGLRPGERLARFNAAVGAGRVIRTDPAAGVRVARNTTVDYFVSRGPQPTPTPTPTPVPTPGLVAVPNVRSQTENDAINAILDAGLRVGTAQRRYNAAILSGRVIRTDPAAGTRVARGSVVDYFISRGPQPTAPPTPVPTPALVAIPNVRNQTENSAINAITDAGLRPGTVQRRFNTAVQAGRVIRTEPQIGTRVARGSVVNYFVSRGPQPTPTPTPPPVPTPGQVAVPNVRNQTENDAINAILDAGLQVGTVQRRFNAAVLEGRVIRTQPQAGARVAPGTAINYFVSRGPQPTPTPPPRPQPTPPPRPEPPTPRQPPSETPAPIETPPPVVTPAPTVPTPAGDLLARIQAAGSIRVNVDPNGGQWSMLRANGTFDGYDVRVAREIASRLGVDVQFTTFPMEEVVAGTWNGRWDIAMGHLATTEQRQQVLDFTQPYTYDPLQVAATGESGITDYAGLAGSPLCVASHSSAVDWLNGALTLTGMPGAAAAPPEGATPFVVTLDQRCRNLITNGGPEFSGWVSSLPTINDAIADGVAVVPLGDPVLYAPIGVAVDRSTGDGGSALTTIDEIIGQLRADGTLASLSQGRFGGLDLSSAPGASPAAPPPGVAPSFTADSDLAGQVPSSVAGQPVASVALSGADLVSLLEPANRDVQRALPELEALASEAGGLANLALVMGSVTTADGSGHLTAARLQGVSAEDLAAAITPFLTNQYGDPQSAPATVQEKATTRISDGPFSSGDVATYLYISGDVVWAVVAAPPVLGQITRSLP
jgi:beta-lactam-binding protein with PASTA domain/ABC-type amino acid transport substrate-binding protein